MQLNGEQQRQKYQHNDSTRVKHVRFAHLFTIVSFILSRLNLPRQGVNLTRPLSPDAAGAVGVVGEVVRPLVKRIYEVKREPRASLVAAAPPLCNLKQVLGKHEVRVGVRVHLARKGRGTDLMVISEKYCSPFVFSKTTLLETEHFPCFRLHQSAAASC